MKRTRHTRVTIEDDRGVFMISVAAELADMHPQTLRMYEARGLVHPKRSPKGTRLYSQADVERLRRIQEMTTELGLNLAGVERVLELEEQLARAQRRVQQLERRAEQLQREIAGLEVRRDAVRAEVDRAEGDARDRGVARGEVLPPEDEAVPPARPSRPGRTTIRVERDDRP